MPSTRRQGVALPHANLALELVVGGSAVALDLPYARREVLQRRLTAVHLQRQPPPSPPLLAPDRAMGLADPADLALGFANRGWAWARRRCSFPCGVGGPCWTDPVMGMLDQPAGRPDLARRWHLGGGCSSGGDQWMGSTGPSVGSLGLSRVSFFCFLI